MAKIKLTKGELKRQRDALRRYQRYLPTLQLKKQQLQMEILRQQTVLGEKHRAGAALRRTIEVWAGLLADPEADVAPWLVPVEVVVGTKNVAGVDLPVFERAVFEPLGYDLFSTPMWMDLGVEELRSLRALEEEGRVLLRGIDVLRQELRITTQRVNLFEKVKIPETEEAIRVIKIAIGDQMANAVGRSKIAKRKIEALELVEVGA